ncbi:MAG: flagellar biosynthetic protein FliR [Candidatus Accumulibacter sp.]|jgi:flagellar biosynthetic protein FliR|nr:flagellar biosynthetic protein FliR [Accumulibacter sp.]
MISVTSAEINAWITAFFFPLARILALLAAAPPFNNASIPRQARLILGLGLAIAIVPALPEAQPFKPATGTGLLILAQQMLIGFSMGFSLRLVFNAVDKAGDMISHQMGLGFATSYDPQNTSQTAVISEFIGILALLLFLSINGHLMVIDTLARSFTALPIGINQFSGESWLNIAKAGGIVFSSGLFLALPIIVTLLITNNAIAILGRIAPQLNLMVIGFSVIIPLGFASLLAGTSYLGPPLLELFDHGLQSMLKFLVLR